MKKPNTRKSVLFQEPISINEEDIFSTLVEKKGTSLFLGKYSMREVFAVLKKRNFVKDAKKRKLWPLDSNLDSSEYPLQRFQIFLKNEKPESVVVDVKIKDGALRISGESSSELPSQEYNFLHLEWLTLQNPLKSFSPERSPLPGQNHPGLNLGKKVLDVFIYLARITRNDGLLAYPAYYHNALLFSRYFHFINPKKQGEIQAIRKEFHEVAFKDLAWIIHLNCLRRENGEIYEWEAEEQIHPLSKGLRNYFDSKKYKEKVKEAQRRLNFSIDWDCYKKKLKEQSSI
ncbi:MAG: hypothetical protein JSV96_02745 [Candidatus Aminicenantes bacterium]|nr:MAG: hypothetical protein JSV96_02745 [Candidatus Aminicenantes bacterium]